MGSVRNPLWRLKRQRALVKFPSLRFRRTRGGAKAQMRFLCWSSLLNDVLWLPVHEHLEDNISFDLTYFLSSNKKKAGNKWSYLSDYTPYSKMAAVLVFFCFHANWPLWPSSRINILLNFTFESEAIRANFAWKQKNTKMAAILE